MLLERLNESSPIIPWVSRKYNSSTAKRVTSYNEVLIVVNPDPLVCAEKRTWAWRRNVGVIESGTIDFETPKESYCYPDVALFSHYGSKRAMVRATDNWLTAESQYYPDSVKEVWKIQKQYFKVDDPSFRDSLTSLPRFQESHGGDGTKRPTTADDGGATKRAKERFALMLI